jgi:hypothetical protein
MVRRFARTHIFRDMWNNLLLIAAVAYGVRVSDVQAIRPIIDGPRNDPMLTRSIAVMI